jgi:type I restriction enzyme, S subunit
MPDMPAPPGWEWVKLTDVARLETGHTPSREHPEYWDGDIPWIGIRDAREHHGGLIEMTQQRVSQTGLDNSAARLLPAGTVCLSRTASVGYVVVMGRPMATSQDFVNWICGDAVDPQFLKYLLIAERESLDRFSRGSTHSTIYFPEVKAFHICIPPTAEQRRIVAKLDELLASSRAVRAALDAVPMLLGQYRQAVLAAACSGTLTADVRQEDTPTLADADLDGGIAGTRLPVPSGWRTVPISTLTSAVTSGSRAWSRYYREDGRGTFIMAQNVRPMRLDLSARTGVEPPANDPDRRRTEVRKDDLLVTIVGANTGDVCRIAVDLEDHFVCQSVALLRPVSAKTSPFLEIWLNSPAHGAGQLEKYAYGQGRPHLSLEQLRSLPISVPPLDEQEVIVRRVRAHFERIETLARSVDAIAEDTTLLEQAALAKAFRGELVPQDPNDEPAAVLLDRIRAERATAEKPASKSPRRKSSRT